MVEQDKRLTDDTSKQSHRAINALTAALEIFETAKLQSFELLIYQKSIETVTRRA